MRIAVFTDAYVDGTGGIPVTIDSQRRYLESLGHTVTIFCPVRYKDRKGYAKVDDSLHSAKTGKTDRYIVGIPSVKLIHPYGSAIGKSVKKIEKWIGKKYPDFDKKFDLVHVHYEFMCSLAGIRIAKHFGLPLVQTMHGREDVGLGANVAHPFQTVSAGVLCEMHEKVLPHSIKIDKDKKLARTKSRAKMWEIMVNQANYADVVITPSEHFAKKLESYGVKKSKLFPVSNAVSDSLMENTPSLKDPQIRELKEGEPLRLFWSNRVSKEKRIIPLLRAINLAEHPVTLDVYGDGNQMAKAKRYVQAFDLGEKVSFFGQTSHQELMQHMAEAHICVFVSYGFDTQGMSILEARASGLPVLLCDPDLAESAAEGGYILAESKTPRDMAEAMDKICENPDIIREMSKACLASRDEIRQSVIGEMLMMAYELAVKRKNKRK